MQLVPHDPTVGVYPSTDDYVHAMEVVAAQRCCSCPARQRLADWLVETEVIAAA